MKDGLTNKEYDELTEYVDLEGCEIGDYLSSLICVYEFDEAHGMGPDFKKAVIAELKAWLARFKAEATIVVTTEEVTRTVTHKELEWY